MPKHENPVACLTWARIWNIKVVLRNPNIGLDALKCRMLTDFTPPEE